MVSTDIAFIIGIKKYTLLIKLLGIKNSLSVFHNREAGAEWLNELCHILERLNI